MAQKIFDWDTPFGLFLDSLRQLKDHLKDHNFYVGVEQDVIDIQSAIEMGEQARDDHGWDDDLWDDFWEFIREHMRAWWC